MSVRPQRLASARPRGIALGAALFLAGLVCMGQSYGPPMLGPYAAAPVGQLPGTATNDNASAGNVGEYVSASVPIGSAVNLTTITAANVTSIALTPGDWEIAGVVDFTGGGTTTVGGVEGIISTTTANPNGIDGMAHGYVIGQNATLFAFGDGVVTVPAGPSRVSISTTTTYFLNTYQIFGTSTMKAYGMIRARRVR